MRLRAKVDFKVFSYRELGRLKTEDEVAEKLQSLSWKDENEVGSLDVVAPANKLTEVKFKDFNLGKILNKYFESDDDMWTWQMRIRIFVYDEKGNELSQSSKIIDLTPGD